MANTSSNPTSNSDGYIYDNTNLIMNPSAVNHLFKQYYNRDANQSELDYWTGKTTGQLEDAMKPNAWQFPDAPIHTVSYSSDGRPSTSNVETILPGDKNVDNVSNNENTNTNNNNNVNNEAINVQDPSDIARSNFNFDGRTALVKFSDDPTPNGDGNQSTVWLFDRDAGTYRAFTSMEAMKSFFGEYFDDAMNNIKVLPTTVLNNEAWKGTFLNDSEGFQDDGRIIGLDNTNDIFASSGLKTIYNKPKDYNLEEWAGKFVNLVFSDAKKKGAISEEEFNKYLNNPAQLSKYINAIAYGGYTANDVLADIKAKQQGLGISPISESIVATDYYKTDESRQAKTNPSIQTNLESLGIDPLIFENTVSDIPVSSLTSMMPNIDWNSDEFKDAADEIQAVWYDIQMQLADASTEQQKVVADANYEKFRDDLYKKYGINISNNIDTAWGQLNEIFSGFSGAGLSGSGLYNEAMDKYLEKTREVNQRLRDDKADSEKAAEINYLIENGSPEQIKSYAEANPEEATKWGLIPSQEQLDWWSTSAIKQRYPDMSDDEIAKIKGMVIDENGLYRSGLYRNLYSNQYGLSEQKKTYQQEKLSQQRALEANKVADVRQGQVILSDPGVQEIIDGKKYDYNPKSIANTKVEETNNVSSVNNVNNNNSDSQYKVSLPTVEKKTENKVIDNRVPSYATLSGGGRVFGPSKAEIDAEARAGGHTITGYKYKTTQPTVKKTNTNVVEDNRVPKYAEFDGGRIFGASKAEIDAEARAGGHKIISYKY